MSKAFEENRELVECIGFFCIKNGFILNVEYSPSTTGLYFKKMDGTGGFYHSFTNDMFDNTQMVLEYIMIDYDNYIRRYTDKAILLKENFNFRTNSCERTGGRTNNESI